MRCCCIYGSHCFGYTSFGGGGGFVESNGSHFSFVGFFISGGCSPITIGICLKFLGVFVFLKVICTYVLFKTQCNIVRASVCFGKILKDIVK